MGINFAGLHIIAKQRIPRSRKRRKQQPGQSSHLERRFALLWRAVSGPQLVVEYKFHATRKWRSDFAHLPSRTLIEIEGGAWQGGRHTRGKGFIADCEKYLEATLAGWTVIRLSSPQVVLEYVERVARHVEGKK